MSSGLIWYDALARENGLYWDEPAARSGVEFFETYCVHVKGKQFALKPFKLEPSWQVPITRCVYGWKVAKGGPRAIQKIYMELARKNGKFDVRLRRGA